MNGKYCAKFTLQIIALITLITLSSTMEDSCSTETFASYMQMNNTNSYEITPISDGIKGKGAFINGIDLCDVFHLFASKHQIKSLIAKIKSDVYKYEFVVLKNQCIKENYNIPPHTFTMIASAFGEISQYYGRHHPANPPNTNITVLSNDYTKGKTLTGALGWHLDGTSKYKPDSICFQYIISAANKGYGGTQLISSQLLLQLMKNKNVELYNRLNKLYSGAKRPYIHPIISKHPITGHQYFVIHTHFIRTVIEVKDESLLHEMNNELKDQMYNDTFLQKYESDTRLKFYTKTETRDLLHMIDDFIENEARNNGVVYITDYEKGDLLIRDNLALIHRSHPSSQRSPNEVGLRVMWRITLGGQFVPSKF